MFSQGISKIGLVRQRNEDRFYAQDNILIVADGMGGYMGGEYASTMVVDTIVKHIKKETSVTENTLKAAIQEANDLVYKKSKVHKELEGMGTTVVVAYVDGNTLYWAHVGDSRLYTFSKTSLHRITTDHSMVQELVQSGTIAETEVMHHPKRNLLTRAIGVSADVEIDSGTYQLEEDDKILLCTDGLTGYVEESRIEQVLQKESKEERILEDLVQLVYDTGARDNVTIVVGHL